MMLMDGVLRPGGLELSGRLADYCALPGGARVIDIGCGTGATVKYLRDARGLDAIGLDVSAVRLARGREHSAALPLIQAAGEELPFAADSAAGIFAECSLSVMQDAGRVLAECYRVLCPGGKLAITDIYSRAASVSINPSAGEAAGIMNYGELVRKLTTAGFEVQVWEDHTPLLRAYIARGIMEYGSLAAVWQSAACGKLACHQLQAAKLGYFLLVAEKVGRGGEADE